MRRTTTDASRARAPRACQPAPPGADAQGAAPPRASWWGRARRVRPLLGLLCLLLIVSAAPLACDARDQGGATNNAANTNSAAATGAAAVGATSTAEAAGGAAGTNNAGAGGDAASATSAGGAADTNNAGAGGDADTNNAGAGGDADTNNAGAGGDAAAPGGAAFEPGTEAQRELLANGFQAVEAQSMDLAALYLLELVESAPRSSQERLFGVMLMAEIYRSEGKAAQSLALLEGARGDFPSVPDYAVSLADAHVDLGDLDAAEAALFEAVQVTPRLDLLARLANLQAARGGDRAAAATETTANYARVRAQLLEQLGAAVEDPQRLLGLLAVVQEVHDPLIARAVASLLRHPDLQIVIAALEHLVKTGAGGSVEAIRAAAGAQDEPRLQQAFMTAAEMLEQMEGQIPDGVLIMPPPAAPEPDAP